MSALYRSIWNDRLEALCDEYQAWCIQQRLPHVDAYEQLSRRVTEEQRRWLQDFCNRWDKIYDK